MKTITVCNPEFKPIVTVTLDDECLNYLHTYHQVRIPLPCPLAPVTLAGEAVPANTTVKVVTLCRMSTSEGWRTVTDAPLDLLMQLPQAVEFARPSAVDQFLGALHTVRKEDGQANHAYQHNRLMGVFSQHFYEQILSDPEAGRYVGPFQEAPRVHGMRFLTDQHQEVPIKFVMEV